MPGPVMRAVGLALSVTLFLSSCGQSRAAPQNAGPTLTAASADSGTVETSAGATTTTAPESDPPVETYDDGAAPTFPEAIGVPTDPHIDATTPIASPQCAGFDMADSTTRESGESFDPAAVASITICRRGRSGIVAGDGSWSTRQTWQVPAEQVAGVASALATPDAPIQPGTPCLAIGFSLPTVVATMTDGTSREVSFPYGTCYPQQHPIDGVWTVLNTVPPLVERFEQVLTETETVTRCDGAKAIQMMAEPIVPFPAIQADNVSICHYDDTDGTGLLVATGQLTSSMLQQLSSSVSTSPPAGCALGTEQVQVPTFLVLVDRNPARPEEQMYERPVLSVGLDPCHLVVDPSWHPVGWASADAVAALTAGLVPVP